MGSNIEEPITRKIYDDLQRSYEYFNRELFAGRLPDALLVLSYHRGAYGYFRSKPFVSRDQLEAVDEWLAAAEEGPDDSDALEKSRPGVDEISLNIFAFRDRTREDILSTLVHEMVHLEQFHFGKPPKRPSHNKEWGSMMKLVGLHPSATGAPGGKETGRKMTHYIVEDGPFARAVGGLDVTLDWVGILRDRRKKKKRAKAKYTCEPCEVVVRGKPGFDIVCGECGEKLHEEVI